MIVTKPSSPSLSCYKGFSNIIQDIKDACRSLGKILQNPTHKKGDIIEFLDAVTRAKIPLTATAKGFNTIT